jgi:methyl-accepting chemotaxis protein
MFNNLKIGVRLGLGFAFVLLMLAAISILSITRINELNAGIDELAEGRIPKIVMADELSLNVQLIGRGVRNMIMTNDKASRSSRPKRSPRPAAATPRSTKR